MGKNVLLRSLLVLLIGIVIGLADDGTCGRIWDTSGQ